jgi:all-trans-retinol 13,14-reductase
MKFDVVIIGSGLGGLQCGNILSREGYNVCILEKNRQLGGCLQTFRRGKSVFDTGMHYIGGMDEGQVLNRFFRYFNLNDRLRLKRLDEDGYDIIKLGEKEYKYSMGYERFTDTMLNYFPGEKEAIEKYTSKLKEISSSVNLYNLRNSSNRQTRYFDYFSIGMDDYLRSITGNDILRNVLLGLAPVYSGSRERTPIYIPMIIHSSFINSAYRFVDGGSQMSDLLAGDIIKNGGTILTESKVTGFRFESGLAKAVEINDSELIESKYVISNIHPKRLLELAAEAPFRPAYRKRIETIRETSGVFTIYLEMKPHTFRYINKNFYVFRTGNVWDANSDSTDWPSGYMMHLSPSSGSDDFTNSVIVNTYLSWKKVSEWENTTCGNRGEKYLEFKNLLAEKLLDAIEQDFPGIKSYTKAIHTSTPLTYRDYIGSPGGSIYGIQKDFNDPLGTMVLPRTSIPNLFHTGQSINIHGVVGVTICSVLTCSELLGADYLVEKFRNS